MISIVEDGRKITEHSVSGNAARMDWAHSVTAFLQEGSSRPFGEKSQLERALAERLFATFGLDSGKIVLDSTYRIHETPEEAAHARELFDELHQELLTQSDPLAFKMIGERDVAGFLRDHFRVGHEIDNYMEALKWVDEVNKLRRLTGVVKGTSFTLVPDTRHVFDDAQADIRLKDERLDRELRDRLAAQFGPFAHEVYCVLYSPLIPEDLQKVEIDRLQTDLAGSPWSSTLYSETLIKRDKKGNATNTPGNRLQAAEKLRFLLASYTPDKPNSVGILFDNEVKIAERVR